jgi:hypothetical protein
MEYKRHFCIPLTLTPAREEFPLLACFAKDIISIPMGSTEIERVFSITPKVYQLRRHRLSPERIHDVMILKLFFLGSSSFEEVTGLFGNVQTIRSTT